jgi:hypothetical protein
MLKKPSVERAFKDESAITGAYYDECVAIVRGAIGAASVLVFDHTLRGPDQPSESVVRVHKDYTEKSAPQRVRDLLPDEAEVLLSHPYVFINVWRPIGHTVIDMPLALCEAASFSDDDLIMTDLVYKDRFGEIDFAHHPEHRWVFFSRMTPDEVVPIKCHDTARDGGAAVLPLRFHGSRRAPRMRPRAKASKFAPSPSSKTDCRSVPRGPMMGGQ